MSDIESQGTHQKREITTLCAQAARAHVRAWRESGMSLPDYSHQHRIAKSTFYGWVERYERKSRGGFTQAFSSAKEAKEMNSQPSTTLPQQSIDIRLPNGIALHIPTLVHSTQVIQFIKGLI